MAKNKVARTSPRKTSKKGVAKEKTITKEIAQQYLKDSGSIALHTFTELDDEAAEVLGKSDGWLNLNGLTHLSDSAAEGLASHSHRLSLNSVRSVSDETARILSSRKGGTLELGGAKNVSATAVNWLASYPGCLELGVVTLSDDNAKAFASFAETLTLPNVRVLSDAAAKSLQKLDADGRLELSERFCKTMGRLKDLCPDWKGLLRFAGWTLVERKIKWKDVPEDVSHILHRALNSGIDASKVKLKKITLSPSDAKSNKEEYFVGEFDDDSEYFSAAYVVSANEVIAEYEN